VSWTTTPLIGPYGENNGIGDNAPSSSVKAGNAGKYFVMAAGLCGFLLAASLLAVGIIKLFQVSIPTDVVQWDSIG